MRILVRGSEEIFPVFGVLRGGALIFDRREEIFRVVPAADQEIVDGRSSSFWCENDGGSAFPEFFERYFRENLASGAPREKFVAESYHELFDREFPRDDLEKPKYYGKGLVRCPRCGRIFRPLSFLGTIRCNDRECRLEMNNPFYDPERLKESIEWGRLTHLAEFRDRCYCVKTQRYYPAPPSRTALFAERFSEWFREWRKRHRRRRGYER